MLSPDQLKDEKLAVQKALLQYENLHGRPVCIISFRSLLFNLSLSELDKFRLYLVFFHVFVAFSFLFVAGLKGGQNFNATNLRKISKN